MTDCSVSVSAITITSTISRVPWCRSPTLNPRECQFHDQYQKPSLFQQSRDRKSIQRFRPWLSLKCALSGVLVLVMHLDQKFRLLGSCSCIGLPQCDAFATCLNSPVYCGTPLKFAIVMCEDGPRQVRCRCDKSPSPAVFENAQSICILPEVLENAQPICTRTSPKLVLLLAV